VGPGVRKSGGAGDDDSQGENEDGNGTTIEFSDHTDVRPTILALLGLKDDYTHDGRVLIEALDPSKLPNSVRSHFATLLRLGRVYKQINAPFGELARQSLVVSTAALVSDTPFDKAYTTLENKLASWRNQRDQLASQMQAMLEGAVFGKQPINEEQAEELIAQANALLAQLAACAANVGKCEE